MRTKGGAGNLWPAGKLSLAPPQAGGYCTVKEASRCEVPYWLITRLVTM
jgi:hypothetical protein